MVPVRRDSLVKWFAGPSPKETHRLGAAEQGGCYATLLSLQDWVVIFLTLDQLGNFGRGLGERRRNTQSNHQPWALSHPQHF